MSYRIASLNIHKRIHKETKSERDFFAFIHDFVADESIDILALQEVLKEEELRRICGIALSPFQNWLGYYERPAVGKSGEYGFAFLWNSDRVSECSRNHTPRIFNEYKSAIRLSRNPLYGRFSPKLSPNSEISQEFRLIDIHLRFSDEVLPNLEKIPGRKKREIECGIVTGEIYKEIDTHRYGNFKPAFTFSLGDYNLSVDDCIRHSGNSAVVTYQREQTTLNGNNDGYASSYDHFSFDSAKYNSVPFTESRVDAVNKYFGGNYEKYYETVSDHVPVVLEIF
jgi:exonuclease III